ncbi:MAG: hypothetical protein JST49_08515 [Bacteroidetes bacterium]|nr:hypothetical protein [Bacteroidota bacterium]
MKNKMKQIALSVCLLCMIVIGCSNINADEPKHDTAGLAERVNIASLDIDTSVAPAWYVYKRGNASDRIPGPSDYYIVAAIKLKSVDVTKYTEIEVMHVVLPKRSDYYPIWMPESIKNYNAVVLGKKPVIYDAKPFGKSSFMNGFFFITDDKYMYIILSTS